MPVPPFTEAARLVEEKLASVYGAPVRIEVHPRLEGALFEEIRAVEEKMFRGELRYSLGELNERNQKEGFFAVTVRRGGDLAAFFFGYADPDHPGDFFGDTLASVIEGRGVGGSLYALVYMLCRERGYARFNCYTEELDEKGRRLRDWYVGTGMTYLSTSRFGDYMRAELTERQIEWMYRRFILGERDLRKG